MDTTALGENGPASRRRFLQAVGLGGAISALPFVARSAGAQSGSSTTEAASGSTASTTPATTTTAPPQRPTADDEALLGFAQSVELAAAAGYDAVIGRADELALPPDVSPVVQVLREHHKAYAQSLSGLLGRSAPGTANAAVSDELGGPFQTGSLDEVLAAAVALEDAAVATHTALLGELQGTDGAALLASILVTEARHATLLTALSGNDDLMPESGIESAAAALTPDDYPVE
ncbi:MAG: ferritin-like domain-containing protein [Acidimicrobiia bacterium]